VRRHEDQPRWFERFHLYPSPPSFSSLPTPWLSC
jgi:hypothetical protein